MTFNNDAYSMSGSQGNNLLPPPTPDSGIQPEIPKSSGPLKFKNRFRIKRSHTYNRNRALPLLMPAGVALYHWSRPSNKPKIADIRSKIVDTAKSPEFKDVISEIAPFLDLSLQHNLYTIIGIIDILHATRSLADGSFQKQHIRIPLAGEPKNNIRPLLKAIKRLGTGINGQVLDNAVLSYEISDKLFDLMRKKGSGDNPKDIAAKRLDDLLYILKPLLPQKHSTNLDKFTRLIKIAQALNATDSIMTNSDTDFTESSDIHNANCKLKTESPDKLAADSGTKRENPGGSSSVIEPHTGALDLAAKLMKLLS